MQIVLTYYGRREAFALRPQHTLPCLPTKNEFHWLVQKNKNALTTEDIAPDASEDKKKSPRDSIRSSDPLLGRGEISPFESATTIPTSQRGGVKRLRRTRSLSDLESAKRECSRKLTKENGKRHNRPRHVRKSSAQMGKALSVHKIRSSVSDEAAILRAHKKKLRESRRRTSEEDPFSLLLSKNELFLKVPPSSRCCFNSSSPNAVSYFCRSSSVPN